MNRTAGSQGRAHQIFGTTSSPRTVLSKHAMNFVHDYGLDMPPSTMPPEIMLRDPLDQEFVLNRKMAKKYYESQLQQKMAENRNKNAEVQDKRKKDIADHETKASKTLSEYRKGYYGNIQAGKEDRLKKASDMKLTRNERARETAIKIIKDTRLEAAERVERERVRKETYDQKLMDEFNRDKNNRELVAAKGDEAAQVERARERDIVEKIITSEKCFYEKITSKEAQLKSV